MNTKMSEQTAKAWSKGTARINEARAGQIAIAWADEQGNKHVGYMDLFDITIQHNGKDLGFGSFLESLVSADNKHVKLLSELAEENKQLRKQIEQETQLLNTAIEQLNELRAWIFPDSVGL